MLTMLDPNEIRLSILRGQVPDGWQIFRGSKSAVIWAVWKHIFLITIGEIILASIASTWLQYFHLSPGLNASFVLFLVEYTVIFLLVGIIFSCAAPATVKNSATALCLEGWVGFNDIHYNLPRIQKFISYASLTDIQLNYNFFVGPYLVLRYRESKARKWYPGNYLARSTRMMILQSILVDYVTYKRSFKECL